MNTMATTRISNGDGWREGITSYMPSGAAMKAMCVPYSMRDLRGVVCVMGDPKGVGVLTTRTRYSRKRYRHTNMFFIPYFSSEIPQIGDKPSNLPPMCYFHLRESHFCKTPGVLVTLQVSSVSYNN